METSSIAEKLARRDAGAAPTGRPTSSYLRQHTCPHCADVTTQTKHGFTETGGLWKGHICECGGWECRGCGEILDPAGECCR